MCFNATPLTFSSPLPNCPQTLPSGGSTCVHSFGFFCSVCWTAGYSADDHDHSKHFSFLCQHCGIPWKSVPANALPPVNTFCQSCAGLKELDSSNGHLPYHCYKDTSNPSSPLHYVCDECLELFLPLENALVNKTLHTSLDSTFSSVFNLEDWALVCPLCSAEGVLPSLPSGDLDVWFERQSRPETYTSFEELGKACRTIVGRREEIQDLLCTEELMAECEELS